MSDKNEIEILAKRCELVLELEEKAKNGDFKSEIEAFNWLFKEKEIRGIPFSLSEKICLLHKAEQYDAQRKYLGGFK